MITLCAHDLTDDHRGQRIKIPGLMVGATIDRVAVRKHVVSIWTAGAEYPTVIAADWTVEVGP